MFQTTLFAARLTIYNESGAVQDVTVYTGGVDAIPGRIQPEKPNNQRSFNSGFKPFSLLVWGTPTAESLKTNQPQFEKLYRADIPSSVTMLMGSIVLWPNGLYGINFDKDGASDRKVRQLQGQPAR